MAKGIFDSKAGSGYDDEVISRYHFPRRYLKAAEAIVGDWVAYREPGTGGGRAGYLAVARVARIDLDPQRPGHFYARVVNRHQELDSSDVENWTVALNRLAARVCAASLEQS